MTTRSRSTILLCATWITVALGTASEAVAQRLPPLLGSKVRIEVDSSPRSPGVVVQQTPDSLTVQVDGDEVGYSVAVANIRHAAHYAPHRSALLALGGFLAGGALGYVAGGYAMNSGIAHCRATPGHNDMCGFDPISVPLYTIVGLVVGTSVGALVRLPHWEPLF
jgi:hypothetical protein